MLKVTATDLPRLMACNGSRLMGAKAAPVTRDTTVRDEGNAADWVVEQVHTGQFAIEELIDRRAANGIYITPEMAEHLEEYLIFATNSEIEIDTTHGTHAWQVSGRADAVRYHAPTQTLYIGDLKYGYSIVEPKDNWTLISHALGFIERNPHLPVGEIVFYIFQPRSSHVSGQVRSHAIGRPELDGLWNELATTLTTPDDMLNSSPHCTHCPGLATCPAASKAKYNAIDASEKVFDETLNNDELSFQLDLIKRAIKMLETQGAAYKDEAMHRVRMGQIVNNYSIKTGLTNRAWVKYATRDVLMGLSGVDTKKDALISPAQAEKLGMCKVLVKSMTERHDKSPQLVRVSIHDKAEATFNKKG